ncbi:GPO family capsid scaffolding protein [Novosphingobium sp. BW1]|uniref:GPO family capsid scaffolding protein n=1 Tax=Novosphingobium sp. BW1 TaxID=2592621 RepID=UPI0013968929|nr:GPO family capsid scaffolding protein [Novosphingobium sp. BW1]
MPLTRYFRVAVEGATTDGREIQRQWLLDAAETYDPQTYTALVNMEHVRGLGAEGSFGNYGQVTGLRTENVTLKIGGEPVQRLGLFAQVDALDTLVAVKDRGQKLFSSIEINPNFAGTGKAYMVGLAVTDSPASLGTQLLTFAAQQGDNNPLAHRKKDKGNLFTVTEEAEIEMEEEGASSAADPTGVFASLKGLLDRFTATPPVAPVTPPAEGKANAAASPDLAAFAASFGQLLTAIEADRKDTAARFTKLTADLAALTSEMESTPAHGFTTREPATGGGENAVRTDC